MPSTTVKNLYVAKCMKELESNSSIESSIKGKATNTLVVSANKIFHAAEMSNLDMDEEKAYVQYARFVELVLLLKSRTDFKQNPEHHPLVLKANAALVKADKLKTSLLKRYSILEEADCRTKNERNDLISAFHNKSEVIMPAEPVVAKVEAPKTPDVIEHSISSSKLFELLTTCMPSIVLMDTRPSHEFNESRIKHSCCINVPQDILKPGTTALKLEHLLPDGSKSAWYKREKADYIILIDLDSKDETTLSQPLEVLKLAMTKWDQKCTLKRPPLVLQGGYRDWMLKYPMYTTQALNFSFAGDSESSPVIADLSAIEYPNLDEPDKETSANKENLDGPGMLFKKTPFPPHTPNNPQPSSSNNARNSKSAPSIDRKSKPTIDRGAKTALSERKHLNNTTITNHSPKGDRSLPSMTNNFSSSAKHSAEKAVNEIKEKELVSSLSKEEMLAKENLELTKEQLVKEEEFEKLRLKKELAAEENIRMEIQKREEQLVESLKRLEMISREKDASYLKIKEDNAKMKKLEEIKISRDSRSLKEKEILEAEKSRKAVMESVERLREQRKKQELEKKKNELAKTGGLPREAVSANSGLKRNMSQQDQNNAQNSEYTIPLSRQSSSGSGHGLVRSHSSPNIAQMVNQEQSPIKKTPTVDRSLKPKPSTPNYNFNEMHRARLRNLNPVHGVCPVRPATGLRNLGNTCFMNSIIQCLSNTKPFADYFTSGQYVEDINRDSKYGSGGEVVEEFAIVIRSLWMGQYKSVSPRDFKNTVSKCLSVCIGNEQQDSHEFLVVLMDKLHADLNRNSTRPIPKLESNADENAFWRHHKNYNSSVVSDIFEGLLKSTLTCMSCRTTSDSFEVFSCLSLPILSYRCSLKDCFQHFLKPEKISGEAAWDCPKCKTKKEAEKRLRISRLPEILVIQLKRFSYEGLWRRKLQTNVDFDLNFNVPYEKNSEVIFRKYSLYGVVNHFGTLEGGHYTAYCNNSSSLKWFKYDDHEVYEMSSSDVKTPAGYLLFYRLSDVHSNL